MSGGTVLIALGLVLAVIGVLVQVGALGWFGHLPGDIRIERGSTRIFIPITSMVIVSLVISVLLRIVRRLLG